jgi:GNAT superfamily N-acetyltransferase
VTVTVRRTAPADFDHIREITIDAKAHWGYDRDCVGRWAASLTFSSDRECWVAEADGRAVAWAALIPPRDGVCILDDLWVDPHWIRRGMGTRLFRVAADRARELGASALEWSAEPNAAGLYEKVGGRKLRDHLTEWGRVAPWMGIEL